MYLDITNVYLDIENKYLDIENMHYLAKILVKLMCFLFFRLCFLQCNANWGIVGAFPEKIPNPVNVKFADKFS